MTRLTLRVLTTLCLVFSPVSVCVYAVTDDLTYLVWSCFFGINALLLRETVE